MRFFETIKQSFHQNFNKAIDRSCADPQDRQILKMLLGKKTGGVRHHQKSRMSGVSVILRWNSLRFLTFNHSILLTNFFKEHGPGWVCFFCCGGFNIWTSQNKQMTLMKAWSNSVICVFWVSGANSRCFVIPIESSSCFEGSTHVIVSRALDFILCQIWIIMNHQICVVSMCCIPCFKQDMFLQYCDNWYVSRIHGSTSKQRNKQRRKEKRTKQTRPDKPNKPSNLPLPKKNR